MLGRRLSKVMIRNATVLLVIGLLFSPAWALAQTATVAAATSGDTSDGAQNAPPSTAPGATSVTRNGQAAGQVQVASEPRRDVPRYQLERPNPFEYGLYGMAGGTAVGLSIGYLSFRDSDSAGEKVAVASAVGLVSGAVLGLGFGVLDLGRDESVMGYHAVKNSLYGVGFGGVVGLAAGSIVAVGSGDGRDALTGLSAGALIGGGVGLVLGIVQGGMIERQARKSSTMRWDIALVDDGSGTQVVTPTLSGVF